MLLKCDKCDCEFKPKIKEKKVNNTAAKTYFSCSNCKEEYLINYTNASIKAKQREIRKVQKDYAALSGKRNIKGSKSLFNRYLKLKKVIEKERKSKREMTAYKAAGLDDDYRNSRIKLRRQRDVYEDFSKAAGVRPKWERTELVK